MQPVSYVHWRGLVKPSGVPDMQRFGRASPASKSTSLFLLCNLFQSGGLGGPLIAAKSSGLILREGEFSPNAPCPGPIQRWVVLYMLFLAYLTV
jgi:hypothetical protein